MTCVFGRLMSQFGDVQIQSTVGMSSFIHAYIHQRAGALQSVYHRNNSVSEAVK